MRRLGGGVRTDGTPNLYDSTRNDGNERGARDGTGGVSNLAFNLAEGVSLFAPIHARSAKLSTGMPLHLGAQPGPRTINPRESKDKETAVTGAPTSCDKNICRIVGAPACRVFPDHLIT